jgi:hypothetical protein
MIITKSSSIPAFYLILPVSCLPPPVPGPAVPVDGTSLPALYLFQPAFFAAFHTGLLTYFSSIPKQSEFYGLFTWVIVN